MKTMGKTTDSCAFLRAIKCFFSLGLLTAVVLILTPRTGYALQAVLVAGGFDQPLGMAAPPGDTARLFVVEHTGKIKIIQLASGTVNPLPFLKFSPNSSPVTNQGCSLWPLIRTMRPTADSISPTPHLQLG